jgi:hypothetical protein
VLTGFERTRPWIQVKGTEQIAFTDPIAQKPLARLCIRLVLVSGLAGCSAPAGPLGPYVTYPLQQSVTGDKDAGPQVAICYDGTTHSLPTVQKTAQDECGSGTLANLLDIDPKLYYCPLLLPTRATFVCQRKE